ncbi:MAG TPA: nucleoside triphosphate pyrophosphohydrolase [Pseudomonadales bacterium]
MNYTLDDLLQLMRRLRDPEHGCPWDIAQTMHSILPSTIEEVYELVDAIEQDDVRQIREELGDVLFQVVFYAQLAAEQGWFDFAGLVDGLTAKLLRRHPHVFADGNLSAAAGVPVNVDEVKRQWEAIKAEERRHKQQHGLLADIPLALPALKRAQKLQKRAAGVGFDWPDARSALQKIREELDELEQALAGTDKAAMQDELGDLLFSCVNVARHLGVDAELALAQGNKKFARRFRYVEQQVEARGHSLQQASLMEMDSLWQQAKQLPPDY